MIPGLGTRLVLGSALTQGPRNPAVAALGVSVGALAWGAAAAVGAAAWLAAPEFDFWALTIVGAAYIAYVAVMFIVRSFQHAPIALDQADASPSRNRPDRLQARSYSCAGAEAAAFRLKNGVSTSLRTNHHA